MSSTEPAIRLTNIGKCYRIFANPQDRFKQALRDRFGGWLGRKGSTPLYREHWALRDISFEVAPGEAVGILGRNGAGKSTLLQIIAGTLAPTTGEVETSGRITALLELGSGFNPEFTGRENVFHNAQILGLTREETENKYDDIAAFADIGDFIDQPVKTYSSGMMMRLAFAVQTAVEPQILIVDEALSVGDMFFQAKCMARINKLVDSGVSLLFVSHDIGAIRQVCRRAVLIDNGNVRSHGDAASVADEYVSLQMHERNNAANEKMRSRGLPVSQRDNTIPPNPHISSSEIATEVSEAILFGIHAFRERAQHGRTGNSEALITNVQMLRHETFRADFDFNDEAIIRIIFQPKVALCNLNVGFKIRTTHGVEIAFFDTRLQGEMSKTYQSGKVYIFNWKIKLPLMHGNYVLSCSLSQPPLIPGEDWRFVDFIPIAYEFRVAPRSQGMIDGYVALPAALEITEI
jgi:lipopolysaccharide transport system ATP-binding protein